MRRLVATAGRRVPRFTTEADEGRGYVQPLEKAENRPFHSPELGFYHLSARWLVDEGDAHSEAIVVGESTFAANVGSHMLHRHDKAEEFLFVLEGQGVNVTENGEYPMRAGDAVFIPKGEWHGFRNTGPTAVEDNFWLLRGERT